MLALVEILTIYSDEYNIISAEEIIAHLAEYGHDVTKRILISDIKALTDSNFTIVRVSTPKKGYYLAQNYSAPHLALKAAYSSAILRADEAKYLEQFVKDNTCLASWGLIKDTTERFNIKASEDNLSLDNIYSLMLSIKNEKQVSLTVSRIVPGDRFSESEAEEQLIVNPLKLGISNYSVSLIFTNPLTPSKAEYIPLRRIKAIKPLNSVQNNRYTGSMKNCTGYFDFMPSKPCTAKSDWLILRFRTEDVELIDSALSLPIQFRKDPEEGFCNAKLFTVFDDRLLGCLLRIRDKIEIISPDSIAEILFPEKEKREVK